MQVNCPKCKNEAILSNSGFQVNKDEFWYCRTCKDEVKAVIGTGDDLEELLRLASLGMTISEADEFMYWAKRQTIKFETVAQIKHEYYVHMYWGIPKPASTRGLNSGAAINHYANLPPANTGRISGNNPQPVTPPSMDQTLGPGWTVITVPKGFSIDKDPIPKVK